MAQMQGTQQMAAPGQANAVRKLTNLIGAAISLALVVGVGVWGYKLLVRDVSGVPVVKAAEGPMRVAPENPGGSQALNQGLSVNNVAAEGVAADPADTLVLAPEPLTLSLEDEPLIELAEAEQVTSQAEADEPAPIGEEAVQLAAVEALATQLADGVIPLQELAPVNETAPEPAAAEKPKVIGGLGRSLRPQLRPASLGAGTQAAVAEAINTSVNVAAENIPAGTRLAQLGAFESAEIAQKEWDRLSGMFGEYLEGKDRVIQKAQSGGRTFYRLRAMGFADLSDARRFCSALVAEKAECIPVVTR